MKLFNIPFPVLALSALLFTATACSDDDDYTPGPEVAADCMNVYFQSANASEYVLETTDEPITLTLSRRVTTQAASVPIVVNSKDAAFNIPSTVEFAAGEADAQISITFPTMEAKKLCKFDITVPDEYIDPYTEVDGTGRFMASVTVDQWVKIDVANPYFYDSASNIFSYSDLEKLESLGRYRFTNFMGSGLSLAFDLDPSSTYFHPRTNCEVYSDDTQAGWYLYDDAADDYPVWTVAGQSQPFTDLYIYESYGTTQYSSYSAKAQDDGTTSYSMTFSCTFTYEDETYWQPYLYYAWSE